MFPAALTRGMCVVHQKQGQQLVWPIEQFLAASREVLLAGVSVLEVAVCLADGTT
jgi:hypothetical protein